MTEEEEVMEIVLSTGRIPLYWISPPRTMEAYKKEREQYLSENRAKSITVKWPME